MDGKKFVRQFPIIFEYQGRKRFFVADFYCHEAKLIIELAAALEIYAAVKLNRDKVPGLNVVADEMAVFFQRTGKKTVTTTPQTKTQ